MGELGNKYYLLAKNPGRKRKIKDPKEIEDGIKEYIDVCLSNPWHKYEAIKSGDRAGELIAIPQTSTMSKHGFAIFMGVSEWRIIEDLKNVSDEFSQVVTWAQEVIFQFQLEGAMANALNSNIVARHNGISDKKEVKGEYEGHISIFESIKPAPND